MGFEPTFLCTVNPFVIEQFAADFDKLKSLKFFRAESRATLANHWNTFYMESVGTHEFVADFDHHQWCEGWTVTFCALQLAFYLGFETAVLVGADHYFQDSGKPNKLVEAEGSDVNHFHPDYFGKGTKWQYPDLARSEASYLNAKKAFENAGRIVLDATIDGHLTIFQKVDYQTIVKTSSDCETHLTHNDTGEEALSKGDLETARIAFEKAAGLAPDYPAALSNLARLHHRLENHKLALQTITAALRIAPLHRGTTLTCVQMLETLGNSDAARTLCRTFLDRNKSDDEDIRSALRRLQP